MLSKPAAKTLTVIGSATGVVTAPNTPSLKLVVPKITPPTVVPLKSTSRVSPLSKIDAPIEAASGSQFCEKRMGYRYPVQRG